MYFFREAVNHQSARIEILGTIASIDVSKPALLEVFLDGQVNDGFFLAIVNASNAAEVRLFVIGFHLVNNFGRQVLHGHVAVIAKKLFSSH